MRIEAAALALIFGTAAVCLYSTQAGGTASASGTILLPDEVRLEAKIAFPAIEDWTSLKIALERWGCLGNCAVYKVEIDGDGTVIYRGGHNVVVNGIHRTKISQEAVRDLFARFRQADFFNLRDQYAFGISRDTPGVVMGRALDAPSYIVGIAFDGKHKTIEDTLGDRFGIPKDVVRLENVIDDVAQTSSWVEGDSQTIDKLRAEGWDFRLHTRRQSELLMQAAAFGNAPLVRQLLQMGIPVRNAMGCGALDSAADSGDLESVGLLVAAGAPAGPLRVEVEPHWAFDCRPLATAARNSKPEIVALILSLHPDVDARGFKNQTPLIEAADCGDRPGCAQTLRLLIEAGAGVNARDDEGNSALMLMSGNADAVRVLLAAGAVDVDRPNRHGETPLMNSYDPEVTQLLLKAGADPYLKNKDGLTALDLVGNWRETGPVLRAWMAAHPRE